MADIAQMPRREATPKNWSVELLGGSIRLVQRATLGSADSGWIKFKHDDGRITMFATRQIISAYEERGE